MSSIFRYSVPRRSGKTKKIAGAGRLPEIRHEAILMSSAPPRSTRVVFLKERKTTDSRAAAPAGSAASVVYDPYEYAFTSDGAFACSFAPVLRFEFDADGLERLAARLALDEGNSRTCGGIICTRYVSMFFGRLARCGSVS